MSPFPADPALPARPVTQALPKPSPHRERFCSCSRADNHHGQARAVCTLHGNTSEAKAYRAGMRDAAAGFPIAEARPLRREDR